jgi:uncharacterized protein
VTSRIDALLTDAKTIAVAGCSPRESRTSHRIARYLQRAGYRVIPVNPHRDEILGERCYPDVASIPADVQVDIVNVFRRPEHTLETVEDTVQRVEATRQHPAVWTQLGVSSPQAERRAREAGLDYVRERCIMVEHARIFR